MIEPLILMLFGHAVADFPMQTDAMAKGKNRNRAVDPSVIPPGQKFTPSWPYWLTSHACVHGLAVYLATGSLALGIAEVMAHWCVDFGKCENWYGIHVDQALHVGCKIIWWLIWLA